MHGWCGGIRRLGSGKRQFMLQQSQVGNKFLCFCLEPDPRLKELMSYDLNCVQYETSYFWNYFSYYK